MSDVPSLVGNIPPSEPVEQRKQLPPRKDSVWALLRSDVLKNEEFKKEKEIQKEQKKTNEVGEEIEAGEEIEENLDENLEQETDKEVF